MFFFQFQGTRKSKFLQLMNLLQFLYRIDINMGTRKFKISVIFMKSDRTMIKADFFQGEVPPLA